MSDFSSDADGVDQLSSFQSLSSKGKLWKAAKVLSQLVDCLLERFPEISLDCFHWALGTAAMSRYRMLKNDNLLSHIEEIKRHLCLVAASQYGLE
ncbi:MAG: hypothetical protein MJZ27_05955 [Bacteroidales bacterium]|nr:hypothetical protein [Bacteroidales bacterium]